MACLSTILLLAVACLINFSISQHFTDCSALTEDECFSELNSVDCQLDELSVQCVPNSLPPLQVVFVIDTTLEDQSVYTSLSDVYDFIASTAQFLTSYSEARPSSSIEAAVVKYDCCSATVNINDNVEFYNIDTFIDLFPDSFALPSNDPTITSFAPGPADLELGLHTALDELVGLESSLSNPDATKIIISTLNYDISASSSSMCNDSNSSFFPTIALELEASQVHHLLLNFDTSDGPQPSLAPTSDPTSSPADVTPQRRLLQTMVTILNANYVARSLDEIEDVLTCLIQDDDMDGDTDESYVLVQYPWDSTADEVFDDVVQNGVVNDWILQTLYQDVSVQRIPARIASAAYGQAPGQENILWLVAGNVTFTGDDAQQTDPPTPEPTPSPTKAPSQEKPATLVNYYYKGWYPRKRRPDRWSGPPPPSDWSYGPPRSNGYNRGYNAYNSYNSYNLYNSYSRNYNSYNSYNNGNNYASGYWNRRRLLRRRTTASFNVSVVVLDTTSLETTVVSEETSSNVAIESSSDTATEQYISFPGSWLQYNVQTRVLEEAESFPLSNVLQPCSQSDRSQFTFLTGGYDNETLATVASVQVFDEFNNSWQILPNMTQDRVYHACAYWNDILYVFGGCAGSANCTTEADAYLNTVEALDLNDVDAGWIVLDGVELNTPRILARSVAVDGVGIWLVGGYNPLVGTLRSVEVYDEVVGQIFNGPNLILSRASAMVSQIEVVSGRLCLYVVGGYNNGTIEENVSFGSNATILDSLEYLCIYGSVPGQTPEPTGVPTASPLVVGIDR